MSELLSRRLGRSLDPGATRDSGRGRLYLRMSRLFCAGLLVLTSPAAARAESDQEARSAAGPVLVLGTAPATSAGAPAAEPGRRGPARLDLSRVTSGAAVIGGLPQTLDVGELVCGVNGPGWVKKGASPSSIVIDGAAWSPEWVELSLAPSEEACVRARNVRLFFSQSTQWPLPQASLTFHVESGVAEVTTGEAQDYQIAAASGGKVVQSSRCLGSKACALVVERDFIRDWVAKRDASLLLGPSYLRFAAGDPLPALLAADGQWRRWPSFGFDSVRLVFLRPLVELQPLNVATEHIRIPLAMPEAVADVSCHRARCTLSADGIDIFAVEPAALSVKLTMSMQPGVFRQVEGRLQQREIIDLPLVRCAIRQPEPIPLLAGVENHRTFLWVGRDCVSAEAEELEVQTRPPTQAWVKSEVASPDAGWKVLEVIFQQVPERAGSLTLTLRRRDLQTTSLGSVSFPVVRGYGPVSVRLRLEDLGLVDFIPSNREAQVQLAFEKAAWAMDLQVAGRQGFYQVRQDEEGQTFVRAEKGAVGNVPLRLAYVPAKLEELLGRSEVLATFDTATSYALRQINVPMPLVGGPAKERPIFRLVCRKLGEEREIPPGRTVSIPFAERNGCRILLDRAAIPEAAGEQRLHIQSGKLDQIISVSHQAGVLNISLPVDSSKEFDSLSLSVGHEYSGGHYDLSPQQNIGAEASYRVILGDRRVRVSAGTALPTGLFRFGKEQDRGSVALSAGAMARINWLYKEGIEFPIGWELGLLSTGLSADPQLSIVTGLGFSIPVLNAQTTLETSFNIHAWLEYSPTRTGFETSQWAFLFGPSFSIGKFSLNL